jgi:hypothetical protein
VTITVLLSIAAAILALAAIAVMAEAALERAAGKWNCIGLWAIGLILAAFIAIWLAV